jgi:integrase/recombinase XerD
MAKKRKAPFGCYWRDATLWGRLKIRGAEIRWSLRTSDARVAARRREERRQRELAAGHFGETRHTYEGAVAAWASWIPGQVSGETAKRYAVSLHQLAPVLRPLFLDEITTTTIKSLVDVRQAAGASIATIRRDLTALSSVLGYAGAMEWYEGNPALSWLRRLRERRDPITLPDPAHVERVIARAPGLLSAMLRAFRATGCRLSELAYAKHAQLDHGRRQLTLRDRTKGNRVRVIELDPFGGYQILAGLPPYLGSAWLFWHDAGECYRNLSSRFAALTQAEHQAAIAAAGDGGTPNFRPFRLHDLRHLHAVEWLKSGRNIYDLQKRLGHRSIKTTEIYLDFLTPEEQRIAKFGVAQNVAHNVAQNVAQQGAR